MELPGSKFDNNEPHQQIDKTREQPMQNNLTLKP